MSTLRSEHASIPLALLVIIVVGGAVAALFGVVRVGTETSGRDRDFAAAIQVADAGIQDAYLTLLSLSPEELDDPTTELDCTPPPGADDPTPSEGVCTGEAEEGGFTWSYTRITPQSRAWQVESWGDYRDSTRMVAANIGDQQRFSTAILSVETLDFSGGGTTVAGGVCQIERFGIGAGGTVKLTGQTGDCINRITVYNQDLIDAPGSSYGVFLDDCESPDPEVCGLFYSPENLDDLDNAALEAFDDGDCADPSTHLPSLPGLLVQGETYCINGNVSLSPGAVHVVEDPNSVGTEAIVNVSGQLIFGANSEVNADGDAGNLLFNVGGDKVTIQSTTVARAAIWAPAAACHSTGGAGTNGQFSGAMTCGSVQISGNWTYDSTVEEIGGAEFAIRNWAERPPRGGPPS